MYAVPRCRVRNSIYHLLIFILLFTASVITTVVQAGTIVRVSTSVGDYSIELLDDIAPATVLNFLNYVNRNDYNGTFLHRVVDNFVAQGGAYRFQPFVGPIDIRTDPPVINEFSVSNTRGTVAMAKIAGNPNSATNQWFVNLTDNSANLDFNNGGFTVFGNVLGDGMALLDEIDSLPTLTPGQLVPSAPYFTPEYDGNPLDFVYINVEVVQRHSNAIHMFESVSGLLITSVDVDGGADTVSMNFNLVASATDVIFEANLESIIPRRDGLVGIATYSSTDTRLRIPSLEVNFEGSISLVTNVVFVLSDPQQNQFRLESYDQQ